EVIVESLVYSSALLPCWFPFIQGEENLLVIWEKVEKDGTSVQVYKFVDGRSDLSNQDSEFRGRTDLSGDLSQGNLELTLTGVSLNDGGVYHCRAANNINHGDKMVVLSVSAPPQEKIETVIEGNVTLVPKYFGVPTEITWKMNSDLLVEMEMAKPKPHFYRLADRAHLDRSGSLTIRYLTKEDSGVYKSEVLITRNIQETEIHLSVLAAGIWLHERAPVRVSADTGEARCRLLSQQERMERGAERRMRAVLKRLLIEGAVCEPDGRTVSALGAGHLDNWEGEGEVSHLIAKIKVNNDQIG
ncbi:uncharacterized protein ACMZJ9_021025, partial [Mantella aurantiaca]